MATTGEQPRPPPGNPVTVYGEDLTAADRLREQLGEDLLDAAVITTGTRAYRRPDGIAVIPAALLGA